MNYVVLIGEKFKSGFRADGNLIEGYGATETAGVLFRWVREEDPRMLGKPAAGVRAYLLDGDGARIEKPGEIGELCLVSPFLALGYNNLPEETAASFTDCPFEPGTRPLASGRILRRSPALTLPACRMYRTGDFMAYDDEGNLLYHGRKDRMVKLRGYRVELGEVENVMQRAEGVKEAACVAVKVRGGDKLCCYYTGTESETANLQAHAAASLTEYMIPDYFVWMEALPRNERNKVNYLALQAMEPPADEGEYVEPETETERSVCAAFASALELPRASVTADFFDMGGTSLSVAMLIAGLKDVRTELSFQDVVQHPTPRSLAAFIDEASQQDGSKPAMTRDFYPLTKTQMGIYLEALTGGSSSTYTCSYLMKAEAGVTAERLIQAVKTVVVAHPSMKYVIRAEASGIPHMFMTPEAKVEVPIVEGTEEDRLDFMQRFMPVVPMMDELLFHFAVYRTSKRCYLALKSHLIFFDATSISFLIAELNRALAGKPLTAEEYAIQQAALREEQMMQNGAHDAAKRYYADLFKAMDDIPSLSGDLEGTLTPGVSENLRYEQEALAAERVKAFCDKNQITESSFFMGAMALMLGKYLNSKRVSFSTVYNGRALSEMNNTLGTLIKRIPIYGDLSRNMPVGDFLRGVSRQVFANMSNDIYSFDEVLKTCPVNEDVEFIYQGDLFTIAEGLLACETIGEIAMLTDADRQTLAKFNDTAVAMDFVPVQEQIHRRALETPEKMAVTAAGKALTFRELDLLSNQLAAALRENGVQTETLVGVLFDREVWAYVAENGILKAGGAFVPFIPDYPDERIDFCMKDGAIPLLLTSKALLEKRSALAGEPYRMVALEDLFNVKQLSDIHADTAHSALPGVKIRPENLAYCIYTSGTTGRPKGVMIEHRNIANYVHRNEKSLEIMNYAAPGRTCLALASFSFDVSVVEEFVPLCNGNSVALATEEEIHTPSELAALIRDAGVTGITCTPTYLLSLLDIPETRDAIGRLTFFDIGAEAFPARLYDRLRELRGDSVILNVYGPTEATMGCAAEVMTDKRTVTVGPPIANTYFYISDTFGNELPAGVRGELIICGDQVGRGYINLPDKTAASFFTHKGMRAYHSGDLAAWTEDGKIRIFGRIDNQIKLRGFRIELDEIEKVMAECPSVKAGAVAVKKYNGAEYLVGYYTTDGGASGKRPTLPSDTADQLDAALPSGARRPSCLADGAVCLSGDIRKHMQEKLPEYMVPSALMELEAMPMTVSGKVDRRALPMPDFSAFRAEYAAPETEAEKAICRAFAKVLNLPEEQASPAARAFQIGALDDFFELGGDSLKAMGVMAEAGLAALTAADIFQKRTPRAIAAAVEERAGVGSLDEREKQARMVPHALTPLQVQVIDAQLFKPGTTMYSNMHFLARFDPAEVDADRLCGAVNAALRNHPALSTAIRFNEDGELEQRYVPGLLKPVEVQEIHQGAEEVLPDVLVMPFDNIIDSCLCRVGVFRSPRYVYLFMDVHHLVMDGGSLGVLLADIANAFFGRELSRDYYFAILAEEEKRIAAGSRDLDHAWFQERYGDEVWCNMPPVKASIGNINQASRERRLSFDAAQVREAEEHWGVSHSVMAIAAALMTLSRTTGKQHVMVNWIFNNRLAPEAEGAVGMLIKNLPAAARMEECATVQDLLNSVKEQVAEGIAHCSYDFMTEHYRAYLNDCMEVNLQLGINGSELDELHPTIVPLKNEFTAAGARLELELLENEYGDGGFDSEMEYAEGCFDEKQMEAFHDLYISILEGIVLRTIQ